MNKTYLGEMRSSFSKTIDQGFGTTFDAHVIAGYRFLMRYYETVIYTHHLSILGANMVSNQGRQNLHLWLQSWRLHSQVPRSHGEQGWPALQG